MTDTTQKELLPLPKADGLHNWKPCWLAPAVLAYRDQCIATLKAENAEAKRYNRYYLDILNRIANGYDSPASLANLAQTWAIHTPECGYNKGDWGECDCGAEDRVEAHAEAALAAAPPAQTADTLKLLIKALAGVRWGFFGECRTPEWDKAPPTPKETSDALEAAIAAIQREEK